MNFNIVSKHNVKKYAIVIPVGSGKTTLSKKYKNIYDIDQFHSSNDRFLLKELYKKTIISNNWNQYNTFEISIISKKNTKIKASIYNSSTL